MIELSLQPVQPVQPCMPEPAQIGDPEGIDFAAQLSLLASKAPVMDVPSDGKAPPPPGKSLPVVIGPIAPELAETASTPFSAPAIPVMPVPVEGKDAPIMRPHTLRPKHAVTPLRDAVPIVAEPEIAAEQPEPMFDNHDRIENAEPVAILVPAVSVRQLSAPAPQMPAPQIARTAAIRSVAALHAGSAEPPNVAPPPPSETTGHPATESAHPAAPNARPAKIVTAAITQFAAERLPIPAAATPGAAVVQIVPQALAPVAADVQPPRDLDLRRRTAAITAPTAISAHPPMRIGAIELPTLALTKLAPSQPFLFDPVGPMPAATTVPATVPDPAPAPQDFAALIDRIVAAREASGAPIAIAVRHAEFGPVTLRFEQSEAGLTVAATSPDPDFARAAMAAMPAERPATAENAPRDGGKSFTQAEASANTGGHSGQPRQPAAASPTTPARNRAHLPATTSETRDSGIFA